ncbi:MAG: KTSC domain-containing protein [Selenomonadaceae bacterium]|nr:KTSC domain-containing protein [Selenomonadaceae bacterium]
MKRVRVKSSAIASAAYEDLSLFVEFVGGKWYKYVSVPETIFERLLAAPSKGNFFNRFIKPVYREVPLTNQELETVRRTCPQ